MAYGHRTKNSRGFASGTRGRAYLSTRGKKRTTSSTYRRLRRAPVQRTKYTVARNVARIDRLARVVNTGKYQKLSQVCRFVNPVQIRFSPGNPYAFLANDFTSYSPTMTNGGTLFGPLYTGVIPNLDTTAAGVGQWHTAICNGVQNLKDEYNNWAGSNDDGVSVKSFTPISATYRLGVVIPSQGQALADRWISIDIVRPKKILYQSAYHKFNLPDSLGAYSHMAEEAVSSERNTWNPTYFSVKRRWLKLPANDAVTRLDQSVVSKFTITFPHKPLHVDMDPTSGTTYEQFHMCLDPRKQVWVVINISADTNLTASQPTLQFSRIIRFRDAAGVST